MAYLDLCMLGVGAANYNLNKTPGYKQPVWIWASSIYNGCTNAESQALETSLLVVCALLHAQDTVSA